ncbi:acyl-CoA reductase [Paenibacillus daejeonensis]|uniref:acyl-CoA reductase n=1 Tax=Paenibacillus daejeonensis TaxID=135193 RepID=UPI00036BBD4E|nr:acyl-CoA reductase [Paenibacillus daejeonensis]
MKIRGGYLPPGFPQAADIPLHTLTFEQRGERIEVTVPAPNAVQLSQLAAYLRERQQELLAHMPVQTVVERIGQAVVRMLEQREEREEAARCLSAITGYARETVRLGLIRTLQSFRPPQLQRFLAQDLHNPAILDGFVPQPSGGWTRAYGPELSTHIWSGNVPGLSAWSLTGALLVKSAVLGKCASSEPYSAGWLASGVGEGSKELAECMAVVWWQGGDERAEEKAFGASDAVVVYGSDEVINSVRGRIPAGATCLGFGHRISIGLVGAETLQVRQTALIAAAAARDMASYDQQGCYSPQQIFVERGGRMDPFSFAEAVAHELTNLQLTHPPHELSLAEAGAAANYRTAAEWSGEVENTVWRGPAGGWSVVYSESAELRPGGLNRNVTITAVDRLEEVPRLLKPLRPWLQSCGLSAAPERLFALGSLLGAAGITRICALGEMTAPEPGWHHDGRFHLLDLLRMVDLDRSAELAAEQAADYRD